MTQQTNNVENRSEIVFLYDAVDTNPNGNPLSGSNRPRVDPRTQEAIVTDVRLKRYLRDQLEADGHGVYIRNVQEEGEQFTREKLLEDRLKNIDLDDYDLDEEDDVSQLQEDIFSDFLLNSADVRYFGATMAINSDQGYEDHLPNHFTGPVQFSPGKTMHRVNENEEYNSLTSVIATQEQKEQGGFDLDDHRIQYGLIRFHGLIDENGATDTLLDEEDVKRLDSLCWRAIKNQTITRSKVGQNPQLYCRVEYSEDSFHIGGLDKDLKINEELSKPDEELRNIRDVTLEITPFINRIGSASDRIEKIRTVASDVMEFSYGGETGGPELYYSALEDVVGTVETIDVYEEHLETIPGN